MSRSPAPSLVERVFAGALFAGASALLYAIWSYFHHSHVVFIAQDNVFKYVALCMFIAGFLIGMDRTAELVFKLMFPLQQPQFSLARRIVLGVVIGGGLLLALEYL